MRDHPAGQCGTDPRRIATASSRPRLGLATASPPPRPRHRLATASASVPSLSFYSRDATINNTLQIKLKLTQRCTLHHVQQSSNFKNSDINSWLGVKAIIPENCESMAGRSCGDISGPFQSQLKFLLDSHQSRHLFYLSLSLSLCCGDATIPLAPIS